VSGPWFKCSPVDARFFEQAPMRLQAALDVDRPASEVWEDLTTDHPLYWCRILKDVSWTSPRPFGEGTTRVVRALGGVSVLKERFFRWEEGRRKSFFVEEANAPLFRRLAEDYLVEPRGAETCRFTWTIAAEPRLGGRPLASVNRRILETLFTDSRRHFGQARAAA
jgi:hypothetical protein